MELCFFLIVDDGIVEFGTTARLFVRTLVGPTIGMPRIHNLYLRFSIKSAVNRMVTNSDPNIEDSTVV